MQDSTRAVRDVSFPLLAAWAGGSAQLTTVGAGKPKTQALYEAFVYSPKSASQASSCLQVRRQVVSIVECEVSRTFVLGAQGGCRGEMHPFLLLSYLKSLGCWAAARVCFHCIVFQKPRSAFRVLQWLAVCIQTTKTSPVWRCYAVPVLLKRD